MFIRGLLCAQFAGTKLMWNFCECEKQKENVGQYPNESPPEVLSLNAHTHNRNTANALLRTKAE